MTTKQKLAASKIMENHGNISKTMLEVGYSPNTAKNPSNLTNSKGWQELMDKNLSDKVLLKVHWEGLKAIRKYPRIVGRDEEGHPEYKYVEEPDMPTRHKYLDSAYKIKNKYKETVVLETGEEIPLEELDKRIQELETTLGIKHADPTTNAGGASEAQSPETSNNRQ